MSDYAESLAAGAELRRDMRISARRALETLQRIDAAAEGRALTSNQSADFAKAEADYAAVAATLGYPTAVRAAQRDDVIARLGQPDRVELDAAQAQRALTALDTPEVKQRHARMSGYFDAARTSTIGGSTIRRALDKVVREHGETTVESYSSTGFYDRGDMEYRALAGYAGTAYASEFADFVSVYARTASPMLNPDVVTILPRPVGVPLIIPRITTDVNTGGTVIAAAGGISEADATISEITLSPFKFGVMQILSYELAQDAAFPIEQFLAESAGRDLAIQVGALLTTGTGTTQPLGFMQSATNAGTALGTVTGTNYTFISPTDLATLFYSVAAPIRSVGVWQASTTMMAKIASYRDKNDRPLVDFGSSPATLWGRPIYENPAMAAVGSASKSVAFGSFRDYYVAKVDPTRVDVSYQYKFGTDQVAVRTLDRYDGALAQATSVAYLVSANT